MASDNQPASLDEVPEAVVEPEGKSFQMVWLLPLVALLVGGWLFYKTMAEKGPEITIRFNTAEGIEQGKTQVKFRDVTVGTVDRVVIADDLKAVELNVTMLAGTEPYLTDRSRFWVVKPRIGATGVSGLGTLFSGAYIAFEPSAEGTPQKSFVGMEQPPIVTIDKEGTRFRLHAESMGSLSIGAPVYYRQLDIGEVTDYKLSDDFSYVDIGIFVESPYDKEVHTGTHFWNAGGLDVSMGADGVKVEMESVVALLSGGVAFETLPKLKNTPVAEEGTVFRLYKNRAASMERPITETVTYALKFHSTVRGLSVGAPVEFRGLRIGTVKAIELGSDPEHEGILSPVVLIDIEPQRTQAYRDVSAGGGGERARTEIQTDPKQRIAQLVEKGLRARLQTGSLVTGQLFVELDMFPDAEPAQVVQAGLYPEIPTLPNSLEGIIASVNRILDRVEKADVQGTLVNLNQLMVSTTRLMTTLEQNAPQLAEELHLTLQNANGALTTLQEAASPQGQIGNRLEEALKEISAAARSIRVMAEYLERHPEALLKGKGGTQ